MKREELTAVLAAILHEQAIDRINKTERAGARAVAKRMKEEREAVKVRADDRAAVDTTQHVHTGGPFATRNVVPDPYAGRQFPVDYFKKIRP